MEAVKRIFAGLGAAFLVWIAASYIDVISDNITPEPQHSNINAFVLFYNAISEEEL